MTTYYTRVQIEQLKREAKRLSRDAKISHSAALDRLAVRGGYANWSLLAKLSEPILRSVSVRTRQPTRFVRSTGEMQQALRKVPELTRITGGATSRADAKGLTEEMCDKFASAHNAIEFAISYMTALLTVPRFKIILGASVVYWEMRCWLPYAAKQLDGEMNILVNRNYKPVGTVVGEWVDYAKFTHLHLQLCQHQRQVFAQRGASAGYLFNDGCPPWSSRKDANDYLRQLNLMQHVIFRR